MGFFSEIVSEARQNVGPHGSYVPAPSPAASKQEPVLSVTVPQVPTAQAVSSPKEAPAPPTSEPKTAPAPTQPEQQTAPPTIDLTASAGAADEAERRRAHEAAEAKRKAEWDAKQAEKRAKRKAELDKLAALSDDDVSRLSAHRVAADVEKLTRRNMKEAVAEYITAKCREDVALARLVMDPEKSMVHCFQYINRQAQEYAKQEMKDNGIERTGVYGLDVPDGLVYQWAVDYFNDQNAKEDHENEEKFVPKPYVPATRQKASKAKAAKGKPEKKKPAAERPKDTAGSLEQISLM